ncbi:MAG: helix-turn-helix transcriptional regulator [Alcanivorax sp.]|uniref:helix-turn-helix transcriptional regulator n=1 Tax=Alcanivorax sp. TaxID=1872427 RepID=UPI003C4A42F6
MHKFKYSSLQQRVEDVQIIRRGVVESLTGLSRSTIYAKMDPSSPYFDETWPKKVSLGPRSVGWYRHEVIEWVESRSTFAAWGA